RLLQAYAHPAHEQRMREILAAEYPAAVVSLSSQVLREYREYERAMTTLVDAAVKPRVAGYVATIRARLAEFATTSPARRRLAPRGDPDRSGAPLAIRSGVPFSIMKSNGGVVPPHEGVDQPHRPRTS